MKKKGRYKKNKGEGLGVVLENIDSKLGLMVEGQQALDHKIDTNHVELREFRKEVDYKFGVVFDELRLIRNDLKEKVGRDEFAALEKRLSHLEKRISHSAK